MRTIILIFIMLFISFSGVYAQNISDITEYEQRIAAIDSLLLNTKAKNNQDKIKYLQENNNNKDSLIIVLKSENAKYINELDEIKRELTIKRFFFNEDEDVFSENSQEFDDLGLPRREREFLLLVKDIRKINDKLNRVSELIRDDSLSRDALQNHAEQDMNDIDDQLSRLKSREHDMNILFSDQQLAFYNKNIKERFNKYLEMIY